MTDYRAMYYALFHATTDAIEKLQQAQQLAEEIYLRDDGYKKEPMPQNANNRE